MSLARGDRGGRGGAGFTLGPETNKFTSTTAMADYTTNNPLWLAEYDANPTLFS